LALFCHVARHGGISAALPHIGYSLQQPALSKQMIDLEAQLGVRLFERQPFRLLPAGERVHTALSPLLATLQEVLDGLADGHGPVLRIEAPVTVISHFFPEILAELRRTAATTRIEMLPLGSAADAIARLAAGECDLVVATEPCDRPDVTSTRLLHLKPALLGAPGRRLPPVAQLAQRHPLVCSRASTALLRAFSRHLAAEGVRWEPELLVGSMLEVASFVAGGHGIGLGYDLPRLFAGLTVQPLHDLSPIEVILSHRLTPCAHTRSFANAARAAGERMEAGERGKGRGE
jgi:DNA-binding transcriptional LysR family regulator